jgi:hypothetical protein
MNATRSIAKAAISHRLAMHLRVDRDGAIGEMKIDNGRLIFSGSGTTSGRQIPILDMTEALLCAGA